MYHPIKIIPGLILLTGALLMGAGCRKKEVKPIETEIQIQIESPADKAIFNNGDTLHLNASVNSPVELHGYTWTLTDNGSGHVLFTGSDHAHGKQFTISDQWINDVSGITEAALKVSVIIDHEGNEAEEVIQITLLP